MFEITAGTTIQIYAPFGRIGNLNEYSAHFDHQPWKAYRTRETKIYEKEEVFDYIRIHNSRIHNSHGDIPSWIDKTVRSGWVVIQRDGKYAKCRPNQIRYID